MSDTRRPSSLPGALLLSLALLVALALRPAPPADASPAEQAAEPAQVACAFTNPAYSGACRESVDLLPGRTPAESCKPVLDCLNTTACLKNYCQATTIRSGWKLESAKVEPKVEKERPRS